MKITLSHHSQTLWVTALLLISTSAIAAPAAQVKLTGQNDVNVDRPAIQAAIDSAPGKHLTVKLRGTFQLDGQDLLIDRSNLVIKGDRGGATLLGKLGPGGTPIDDIDNFPNRGFLIESSQPLSDIEIKDLTLTGFRTAVFVKGQENAISDVQVKNNYMENSFFAVSAIGAVSNIFIANNWATGLSSDGITVFGTLEGQPSGIMIADNHITQAGSDGILIRDVSDVVIANNHITEAGFDGILIRDVSDVIIANNFLATSSLSNTGVPFFAGGSNTQVQFAGNTTQGGVIGVLLIGNASDFLVTRNCIREGGTQGLPFLRGGGIQVGIFGLPSSGFDIADNSYSGNLAGDPGVPRDIWLTIDSSDSTANERPAAVVVDEGASNSVGLLADDGVNHCQD